LDQRTAIYIIPSLGGGERKVADVHVSEGRLSWSPDGRSLVMGERNGASESQSLYLIAAENGERFRLTKALDAQTRDLNPVFRPNGRDLLFTRCASYIHCGLYLQELSKDYRPTAKPRILKEESGYIKGAAWTTSGQEVVYAVSDDAGLNPRLKRTRVGDTAFTEQLTYAGEHLLSPVIARTGNRLAYAQDLSDVDIWQVEIGKQPRTFASSTRFEYAPQYSPDGKHVAFSSDRSGQMQIWICDADGGNPIQLTHFEEHTGTPRWSADGRWIAFDRHVKEGFHIFVMASDGGQVRKLTSDEGDEAVPSWSTDGNWIYYSSNRTGRYEIWRAPAKGGKASQVTRSGGFVAFESHDGKFLYYTKVFGDASPSGLWELPLAGGEERLVLESVQTRAFAVENGGIYYISAPAPDGSSLRFHNLATRKDQGIVSIQAETFQGLTVSPDRKTFLFSGFTRTGSNVMVVEHFR
jgi:Tol biopolymer transport system component